MVGGEETAGGGGGAFHEPPVAATGAALGAALGVALALGAGDVTAGSGEEGDGETTGDEALPAAVAETSGLCATCEVPGGTTEPDVFGEGPRVAR